MASPPVPLHSDPEAVPTGASAWSGRPTTRVYIAFAFACLLTIAGFWDVWASMVKVWTSSETFAHGFIVLPCTAWMLWRRSADWSALPQRVWWPAIVALGGCGLVWLVGRLSGVASLEQLGVVAMIPSTMLLLVGPRTMRAIAFPLAFLFFAVPIGEFLTPILMQYTADATVAALRWTGIPVFREGLHFTLPTGRWSVVEACSGLRYLIASLALGVLYAYLQFRTLKYRIAFVALALVVPIVANWARAYGIVLLGHVSDMQLAAGADHLIYGWLFFGLVMALLFWIGSLWREPPAPEPTDADGSRAAEGSRAASSNARVFAAVAVAVVAAFLWRPLSAGLLDATQPVDAVASLRAATQAFPPGSALTFEPHFTEATSASRSAHLVNGAPVELHAFYYARQHETHEMIHAGNGVVRADDYDFPVLGRNTQQTPWGTATAYRIGRTGANELLVWQWFAVGPVQTSSAYRAKAATAWSLVTGQGDHSLAVVLATPLRTRETTTSAEAIDAAQHRLSAFATALQPAIEAITQGRRPNAQSLVKNTAPQRQVK